MARPTSRRGRLVAWVFRRQGVRPALANAYAAAIDPASPSGIEAVMREISEGRS